MLPMIITTPQSLFAVAHPLDVLHGLRTTSPMTSFHGWHDLAKHHRQQVHQLRRLRDSFETAAQHLRQVHEEETMPSWSVKDHYAQLSDLRLPAHEDGSLSARLSSDGRSLQISGKACTCQDTTFAEVRLPYGAASTDDVELLQQDDGTLSVRARKPEKPTLDVKIVKPSPAPTATELSAASTAARDEKEEERALDSKFKIAIDAMAKQAAAIELIKDAPLAAQPVEVSSNELEGEKAPGDKAMADRQYESQSEKASEEPGSPGQEEPVHVDAGVEKPPRVPGMP